MGSVIASGDGTRRYEAPADRNEACGYYIEWRRVSMTVVSPFTAVCSRARRIRKSRLASAISLPTKLEKHALPQACLNCEIESWQYPDYPTSPVRLPASRTHLASNVGHARLTLLHSNIADWVHQAFHSPLFPTDLKKLREVRQFDPDGVFCLTCSAAIISLFGQIGTGDIRAGR